MVVLYCYSEAVVYIRWDKQNDNYVGITEYLYLSKGDTYVIPWRLIKFELSLSIVYLKGNDIVYLKGKL